jgi:hypothetical protein
MFGKLRSSIEALLSPESIQDALGATRAASNWTPAERTVAALTIRAHLRPPDFRELDNLEAVEKLLQCRITNDGNEPAHEVVLDLPYAPSIEIMDSASLPVTEGQKSIPLGVMRPGVDIDLRMWFRVAPFWNQNQLQISYQSGRGKVALFDIKRDFPGPVARFVIDLQAIPLWAVGWLGMLGILLVVSTIGIVLRIRAGTDETNTDGRD